MAGGKASDGNRRKDGNCGKNGNSGNSGKTSNYGKGKAARRTDLPADGRCAALKVLTDCRRNGAWADSALRALLDRSPLSPADAALTSRLVYGVLQNRLLLDFYLNHFCTQRVDHLQRPLPDILRLGAYQILFLDRVPDRAAVGEAVELAKRSGQARAAGLVNAVLRNLSRSKDEGIFQNRVGLPPLPEGTTGLSIRYSHPLWLTERLVSLLGVSGAEAFLAISNTLAPLTVQVNPLRADAASLRLELSEAGVTTRPHPWVPGCLELDGAGDLTKLEAFRAGKFTVQDPAARLVTWAAGIRPGQRVLDLCAAPGGKSFSAAMALLSGGEEITANQEGTASGGEEAASKREVFPANREEAASKREVFPANREEAASKREEKQAKGEPDSSPLRLRDRKNFVLSCDLHANKLNRVREGAARLGLSAVIETVQADGRECRPEWENLFDVVLADVPCSGLGVVRKKPDIRYKDPAEFTKLPDLQRKLLDNAAACVRPGGTLVYSTCTILPEENQGVTDRFLQEHPDFARRPFPLPEGFPGERETDGQITLWPHRHSTDGFYLCVMERRGQWAKTREGERASGRTTDE